MTKTEPLVVGIFTPQFRDGTPFFNLIEKYVNGLSYEDQFNIAVKYTKEGTQRIFGGEAIKYSLESLNRVRMECYLETPYHLLCPLPDFFDEKTSEDEIRKYYTTGITKDNIRHTGSARDMCILKNVLAVEYLFRKSLWSPAYGTHDLLELEKLAQKREVPQEIFQQVLRLCNERGWELKKPAQSLALVTASNLQRYAEQSSSLCL